MKYILFVPESHSRSRHEAHSQPEIFWGARANYNGGAKVFVYSNENEEMFVPELCPYTYNNKQARSSIFINSYNFWG